MSLEHLKGFVLSPYQRKMLTYLGLFGAKFHWGHCQERSDAKLSLYSICMEVISKSVFWKLCKIPKNLIWHNAVNYDSSYYSK